MKRREELRKQNVHLQWPILIIVLWPIVNLLWRKGDLHKLDLFWRISTTYMLKPILLSWIGPILTLKIGSLPVDLQMESPRKLKRWEEFKTLLNLLRLLWRCLKWEETRKKMKIGVKVKQRKISIPHLKLLEKFKGLKTDGLINQNKWGKH